MADITNLQDRDAVKAVLRSMDDAHLIAQDLMQQGAIHAVSFLLANGCTEQNAAEMLASLRDHAAAVRAESRRRGKPDLFSIDQTAFS